MIRENAIFSNLKAAAAADLPGHTELAWHSLLRQEFSKAHFFWEYLWTSWNRSLPSDQLAPKQNCGRSC